MEQSTICYDKDSHLFHNRVEREYGAHKNVRLLSGTTHPEIGPQHRQLAAFACGKSGHERIWRPIITHVLLANDQLLDFGQNIFGLWTGQVLTDYLKRKCIVKYALEFKHIFAYRFHLGVLHLHIDDRAKCVKYAALFVAPSQQHLGDGFETMTLEGTLLCARKSGQVENNAAAQLDDLFVQLGANGLGHDGVAEVGNKGGISNQGLWHFAGDFDWDKKLQIVSEI